MNFGAWRKTSVIEVPGYISTVLFTNGCNFSCGYCHVPFLLTNQKTIPEKEIFEFLKKRKEIIEFVVVSGGEPTLQPDLLKFYEKVKKLGYKTALETNGSKPEVIKELLNKKLLDYIAMDIKTDKDNYDVFWNPEDIDKSIKLIINSNIKYEFRTTMATKYVIKENFEKMMQWISGAKNYYIQQFVSDNAKDKEFREMKPYTSGQLAEFCKIAKKYVEKCELRC